MKACSALILAATLFAAFCAPADEAQANKTRLEDDGTCWAVTEKGTRCKHKKAGDSDYCKQHAADVKPSKPVTQCRALKYDGDRCTRAPEPDCFYCAQHKKLGALGDKPAKAEKPAKGKQPKAEKPAKAEKAKGK